MQRNELESYWKYYLFLERKFIEATNYVELCEENKSTYSIEFHNQIISIGSELDSFFKAYCGMNLNDTKTITDYARHILKATEYPAIVNEIITVKNEYKWEIQPFENWNISKPKQSLFWWEAFDNLKHGRKMNMKEASLSNALNLLSALFLLEMKMHKITGGVNTPDIPDKESELFSLNWKSDWRKMTDLYMYSD